MIADWPVTILPVGPVSVGTRVFRYKGNLHVSVLAKVTFELVAGAQMKIIEPEPIRVEESVEQGRGRAIVATTELAPILPRGEVTFVGHAHAHGKNVRTLVARLALARPRNEGTPPREGPFLLDKSLSVVGTRTVTSAWPNPQPTPFTKIPVNYERALGGPNHLMNPLGTAYAPDARGRTSLPNIENPKNAATPVEPAGFAPISSTWPARQRLCRELDELLKPPPSSSSPGARKQIIDLPDDIDLSCFHAAPLDQRIGFLQGDEWIILENLHAEEKSFESQLPGLTRLGRVFTRDGAAFDIEMRADALHIDGDKSTATLIYRGSFPVMSLESLTQIAVCAGVEPHGAGAEWPSIVWPHTLVIEAGSARPIIPGTPPASEELMPDSPPLSSALFSGGTLMLASQLPVSSSEPLPLVRERSSSRRRQELAHEETLEASFAHLAPPPSLPRTPPPEGSGKHLSAPARLEDWQDDDDDDDDDKATLLRPGRAK